MLLVCLFVCMFTNDVHMFTFLLLFCRIYRVELQEDITD